MKRFILLFSIFILEFCIADELKFGVISPINNDLMKQKLTPFMKELEKVTGDRVVFKTGYDYADTIRNFANGNYDIGLVSPSSYIAAMNQNPKSLEILAGIKNSHRLPFRSVIVTRKDSYLKNILDLKGKKFAFGTPNCTLSYYVPRYMLQEAGVFDKLSSYQFLNKQDKVAKLVIIGKYDAGSMRQSVANKYAKYLKVIDTSEEMPGFMIVARKTLDKKLKIKIKKFLLNMKDISSLKKIEKAAQGFEKRYDSQYGRLRKMMNDCSRFQ